MSIILLAIIELAAEQAVWWCVDGKTAPLSHAQWLALDRWYNTRERADAYWFLRELG